MNLSGTGFAKKRSFGSVFLSGAHSLILLGWLMLGLCWLLPNHYLPWLNFHSEALAVAGLSILFAAYWALSHPDWRWPGVAWVLALVGLIPWLQWWAGVNTYAGDALVSSMYLWAWAMAVALGFGWVRQRPTDPCEPLLALMHTLWIAALLSAMIGLAQWLRQEYVLGIFAAQADDGDRAMGNLAQPNQLGTLLLMGMVALTWLWERRTLHTRVWAMAVLFMTWVLVLTQSRIGMMGAVAIACVLAFKRTGPDRPLRKTHLVVWLLTFFAATALLPTLNQAWMLESTRPSLGATHERLAMWLQTLEGVRLAPWWGYGFNQTFTASWSAAATLGDGFLYTYAHNAVLDVLAWTGIPLGLALTGAGAYWFISRNRAVAHVDGTYAMACLWPFVLHSLVEFPFAYAYFLIIAGLLMGVVEAHVNPAPGARLAPRAVSAALAAWMVVGVYFMVEYVRIEEDYRVVRFENLRVGKTEAGYEVPKVWMLSHMGAMLKVARQRPTPGMSPPQMEDFRQVAQRTAVGTFSLRYAMALGLNGQPDEARRMLQTIKGTFGSSYYRAVKEAWAEKAEDFPELAAIVPP